MKLETVTIETKAGPVVINKSDFDKSKHNLHKEKPAKKEKPVKAK
tara:strand:- start:434 stop:568 length:135 start_codon:yes stop_codon:yes gene_type:complete